MLIIEINALENGAHRNQDSDITELPGGWAAVPEDMELENFPFGEVSAELIDGRMTVTGWIPGTIPPPEPHPEAEASDTEVLNVLFGVTEDE